MKLTGAQIVVECLKEQGVDTVFGFPGAATINIHDEIYKTGDEINLVLTSHEQGSAHAADGYSRATDKTGVCLATSGPGATNLVTGIATAYMDSIPMVAITGNVPVDKLGKDSFQEVDIQGITMPVVKHNYMVKDVNKLADTMREAFYIANSGRKGPVHIDIPKNLTVEIAEYERQEPKPIKVTKSEFDETIYDMIREAKRPLIFAGGGVILSKASKELTEFAEKINAPVACSLMSIGCIPYEHELYIGMVGMHGTMTANKSFNECDLLIAIGTRFSDRVVGKDSDFAKNAKIIHIDIDPAEVNKNVSVDFSIIGDVKEVLTKVNERVEEKDNKEWMAEIKHLNETYPLTYDTDNMNVPLVIKKIAKYASEDDIVCTDVGQHQMWTAQHYPFAKPDKFLTSGGLGTMGYGLGAAFGAGMANPDKHIILITGDGSFRMNYNEIITAVRHNIPVKIFVMNNLTLGMVRQWQDLFYEKRFAATQLTSDIDYVMFAKSQGANGYNINHPDEIEGVVKEVFENDKVCIVNCNVKTENFVFPMVPPGKAIHEAINE